MKEVRIVYMGTPEFAVPPLHILTKAGYRVVAVVTAPDRPAGRGKKIRQTAVKEYAVSKNIPVLQPEKLRDPAFIEALQALKPDLQVVVAFRMLPEMVWRIPPMGTFNLHASLLPDYRGAAPINHVIMNGETLTGVTTFLIDEKIDTGNILLRKELAVGLQENAGELHDRLMHSGAELVLDTVEGLCRGDLKARPQEEFMDDTTVLHAAPKIQKEDCRIDWSASGKRIVNKIRGLSPYPGAFSVLNLEEDREILFKIYEAAFKYAVHEYPVGSIHYDGRKSMKVAVEEGFVKILSLQQEGKKRMDAGEFLLGFQTLSGPHRFS